MARLAAGSQMKHDGRQVRLPSPPAFTTPAVALRHRRRICPTRRAWPSNREERTWLLRSNTSRCLARVSSVHRFLSNRLSRLRGHYLRRQRRCLEAGPEAFDGIAAAYPTEVAGATEAAAQETIKRIRLTTELASAVQGADLVIEAVPESLELKRDVFARIAAFAPPATVVVTNSSTLLPSDLMDSTGRPDRFLALHFANHIWVNNTAEVMGSPNTDPRVYQRVVAFAKDIGMVPIELHKEQPGYIVNSLLRPLLMAATDLLLRGVADRPPSTQLGESRPVRDGPLRDL